MSQSRITNSAKFLNKAAAIKPVNTQLAFQQTKHRVLPRNGSKLVNTSDHSIGAWPGLEQNLSQFDTLEPRFGLPGNTGHPSLQDETFENYDEVDTREATHDTINWEFLDAITNSVNKRKLRQLDYNMQNEFADFDEKAAMAVVDASSKLQRDAENFEKSYQQLDEQFGLTNRQQRYEEIVQDALTIQKAFKDKSISIAITGTKIPGLRSELRKVFNEEACKFGKRGEEIEVNTVYTVAFETNNDMASWTDESATEREQKMREFYQLASAFVNILSCERNLRGPQKRWADFIDPEDGKSFMNKQDNGAIIEATNKSYNEINELSVEDFGCCELLKHNKFGSNVFVGTIVSNGSHDEWFLHLLKNGVNVEKAEKLANWAVPKIQCVI